MTFPFRCTGKHYPNATARAILGCTGRVPPWIWQFKWEEGVAWAEPFNGQWQNAIWTDPGTLPPYDRTNWNTGGLHSRNFAIEIDGVGRSRLFLDIPFDASGGGIGHEFYYSDFEDGWFFDPDFEIVLPFRGDIGGVGPVADDEIPVRIGTYDRIPANSCIGA